jgi:uncharacterized protein YdgA (DUF945 family)
MKRIIAAVLVLAVLLLAAPWVIGNVAEDRVGRGLEALVKAAPTLGIVEQKYRRGWFRSEQEVTFEVLGGAMRPLGTPTRFTVRNEILHGPVLGLSGLGIARVNSRLVLDPGVRAELVAVFGSDEPLRVSTRVGFLGGGRTFISSDAREVKLDDGGTIAWDDLEVAIGYSGNFDSVDVKGRWPRFESRNPRLKSVLRVADLVLDLSSERVKGHLYQTDGEFSIDDLTFASDGEAPTTLEDLAFVIDTRNDDDFTTIATRMGTGRCHGGLLQSQGLELTAVHYDFTVRRLHTETLARLADAIAESYQRPEVAALLTDEALELLKYDPELVIDRVGFETKDGAAILNGVLRIKGATEKDLRMGALSLVQRIEADLHFDAPQTVIENLPRGRDAIRGAVDGGYVETRAGRLASHVEFRAGELKINGKVQGMPGLGAPVPNPGASPE